MILFFAILYFLEIFFPFSDQQKEKYKYKSKKKDNKIISVQAKMIEPTFFKPDDSFKTLDYTYSFSKYSCVAWVYPLHILFAYLIVITGILAMLSRIVDKLRPYHTMFGRWYLIFMFWCMASSLLIYTNGLPFPIIISFLYLLISLTIGWNSIKTHSAQISKQVFSRINARLNASWGQQTNNMKEIDIQKLQSQERSAILKEKSFKERIFSYKMLHGMFMSFSWYQMAGRLMVTNPFNSFHGCWTYPAYKSSDIAAKVFAVDGVSTPAFPMNEGSFLALITIPTVIVVVLIGVLSTYWYYKIDMKQKNRGHSQSTITAKLTTNS